MKTKLASIVLLTVATAAQAHVHLSVGVNAAGNALQFVTYGDATAAIANDGRYVAAATNLPIETPLNFVTSAAPFTDFATGPSLTITTDFYSSGASGTAAPAAWAGVDVWLELAAVTPVSAGARADNVAGYSVPAGDSPYQDAITSAATLADRAVDLGSGNHFHGTSLYSRFAGTYDLTFVAHDLRTGGTALANSTPLILRVTAVPEPTMAMIGLAALPLLMRRRVAAR